MYNKLIMKEEEEEKEEEKVEGKRQRTMRTGEREDTISFSYIFSPPPPPLCALLGIASRFSYRMRTLPKH